MFWQNDDAGKDQIKGLRDGLGDKANMIIADKSYEVERSHHRFADRGAARFRRRYLLHLGGAEGRGAGDPQGRRTRLEADILPRPTSSTSVATVLKPAGLEYAKDIISTAYLKDPTDPTWKDDPGVKAWRPSWTSIIPDGDKTNSNNVYGYAMAQTMVQVLKQCGDNLTRENVMKQAASLKNFTTDVLLPGITINTGAERLLSDRADAADEVQRRELGAVRRRHHRRGRTALGDSSRIRRKWVTRFSEVVSSNPR